MIIFEFLNNTKRNSCNSWELSDSCSDGEGGHQHFVPFCLFM